MNFMKGFTPPEALGAQWKKHEYNFGQCWIYVQYAQKNPPHVDNK